MFHAINSARILLFREKYQTIHVTVQTKRQCYTNVILV